MKRLELWLLLAILLSFSFCLFEKNKQVRPLEDLDTYESIVNGSFDHTVTIVVWHPNCEKCELIEEHIAIFSEQMRGLAVTYHLNCEQFTSMLADIEIAPMCKEKEQKRLPFIMFITPPKDRFDPITGKRNMAYQSEYAGSSNPRHLIAFTDKVMPNYVIRIRSQQEISNFLESTDFPIKVVLFTKKLQTSILYKGLASHFYQRLQVL